MQQLVVESCVARPPQPAGPQTIPPATATALGDPPPEPVFVVTNNAVECLKLRLRAPALAARVTVAKADVPADIVPLVRAAARANVSIPTYAWVDEPAEWLYLCPMVVTEETPAAFVLQRKWWAA